MLNVLLAGGGYVAAALAARLESRGAEISIVKRTPIAAPPGGRVILADVTDDGSTLRLPEGLDAAVYSLSADEYSEEAYRRAYVRGVRNTVRLLEAQDFRGRFIFLSSTGVYAQENGEWVDERSAAAPAHFSGVCLLEGEQLLRDSRLDHTIVRLGGIYGPGRTRLIDDVRSGRASLYGGPPQYTNRIHRDDAAGLLEYLLFLPRPDELYLAVDSEPAAKNDVVRWIAERLGAPIPPLRDAPSEPMRGNKQCSNRRIVESGYCMRFPSFRDGYGALL